MIKLPLVGAAYKMQSQSISCQNCINWYPQTIEYPNGSRVAALMPTPGLKKVFSGDVAATRCLYVLSNGALLAVIGKKLYHSKASKFELTEVGSISALGTVRIADNGQIALIVNGTYTYSLNLKTLSLERLSGSTIPRSTHVLFLDGRFVVNKANTGQFYWSDLYSTTVNALSYATAESTPDNITAIITFNRELWLFGAQSVERYYGTGSSNSPFSRLSGGAMAFGCVAPDSIISLSTGVIWLGVSEFGGNQIVISAGGLPERISTHALEEEISSYSKTSDASAYAYQQEGHVFYVISFPSANVTFCFDVSTGLWHQRSFTNVQGLHERHRSQHHAYFNNAHIVGDYRNGKLYQLDNNTFTDDGELILRERTAQAVITDKKLTRFNQLQIVCETGFFGNAEKEEIKPPMISCDGATNISGCISWENGKVDLEIDDVLVLTDATTSDLETYLFANEQLENSLAHHCGCDAYVRQINVPYYHYLNGDKLHLPVALQPNGQSVTSPFIVQGSTLGEIINFIADTLNSQLEPYGLHCVYGLFASTNIFLGVTDNRTTSNYKDTEFYILDEGNTFTKEQIPRGLPPYYCFMPT